MKEILDHLISVLKELPAEEWREEENQYITSVNLTRIHRSAYRDILGYYTVVVKEEEEKIPLKYGNFVVSYLTDFTLKVLKDNHEVFTAPRLSAMRLYEIITNKIHPKLI